MTSNPDIQGHVTNIRDESKTLLLLIKTKRDSITLNDANALISSIREIEGWLQSCGKFLTPGGLDG